MINGEETLSNYEYIESIKRNNLINNISIIDYSNKNYPEEKIDNRVLNLCREKDGKYEKGINDARLLRELQQINSINDLYHENLSVFVSAYNNSNVSNFIDKNTLKNLYCSSKTSFNNINSSNNNDISKSGLNQVNSNSKYYDDKANHRFNDTYLNQNESTKMSSGILSNAKNKGISNSNVNIQDNVLVDNDHNNINKNDYNKLVLSNQAFEYIQDNCNDSYISETVETICNDTNNNRKNNKLLFKCPYFHQNMRIANKYHFFTKCFICDFGIYLNNFKVTHKDHIKFNINYDVNKLILQTKQLIKLQDYLSAYNILSKLIKDMIYHSDVFFLIGEICFNCCHYSFSKKYFYKTLQYERYSNLVLYYLGLIAYKEKEFDLSVYYLTKYLDKEDQDSSLDRKKMIENHNRKKSENIFKILKERKNTSSKFYSVSCYILSLNYIAIKEFDNAFDYVNKALEDDKCNTIFIKLRDYLINTMFNNNIDNTNTSIENKEV